MTALPCPEWCVTDHARMEAERDWSWDDLVEHGSEDVHVPVQEFGGGDSPTRTVYVSLTVTDNIDTGERDPVGVWLQAGGETLSPERAVDFAVAILNAARLATGARLDLLAGDGDRGTRDRRYAAKSVLHSLAVSWPATGVHRTPGTSNGHRPVPPAGDGQGSSA